MNYTEAWLQRYHNLKWKSVMLATNWNNILEKRPNKTKVHQKLLKTKQIQMKTENTKLKTNLKYTLNKIIPNNTVVQPSGF